MHITHKLWPTGALLALMTLLPACAQDNTALQSSTLGTDTLWVESLDLGKMTQGYNTPQVGHSIDKNPLTLGGTVYPHGVGTHAQSELIIDLKGAATKFLSMVGVDDEKKGSRGSVVFHVYVDGKKAADSGVMRAGDAPKLLSVDLIGAKHMTLRVDDAGDGIDSDHADWAGAMIQLTPGTTVRPVAATVPVEPPRLVMVAPDPRTAIHGPRVYGSTPGHPFLFLIPATGQGPLTFSAGPVAPPESAPMSSHGILPSGTPDYRLLFNPAFDYTDLLRAKARGLDDDQIAVIVTLAEKTGQPFRDLADAVLRGETFAMLADRYSLKRSDVLDVDDEKARIANYVAAYESMGPQTEGGRVASGGLPDGLTLDPSTGIISGSLRAPGTTTVRLTVRGPRGTATRNLTIVGGPRTLALTPPMGWNSWNSWAGNVDDGKVRASADAMIRSSLAGHGFQFINIDDTWEAGRDANGVIQSNAKFPSMKGLADYVHGLGLKIGLYSSPGPKTCAGFTASYQHELQDAQTYADWGYDYLKYDWCSYGGVATGEGLDRQKKPYITMGQALGTVNRDIVYSLCQYGMGDVWTWGADPDVSGNCWRTTGDINDSWGSLYGIYSSQNGHEKYITPGHWNDPDMLVVGQVGWGNPHPSHLTPNEQILHISMWCLLASPLLIGCDMSKLDPFTLALLTNDEALDINQDPLGKPAGRVSLDGSGEVWARPLFDGTTAVGLLNNGTESITVTAKWADLGLKGRQPVRDLWLHKEVANANGSYAVQVPAHGAVMLKIGKPRRGSD